MLIYHLLTEISVQSIFKIGDATRHFFFQFIRIHAKFNKEISLI